MASTRTLVITGLAFAALLALTLTAQAQTQQPGFGEIVGDVDDVEHFLRSGGPDTIQYRDSDSSGTFNSGERVFLADGSTTSTGDVRLANPLTGSVFTKISNGDSDQNIELTTLSGELRFFDADHSSTLSPGETLYYDLDQTTDNEASTGDLILTGPDAGTVVSGGHDQLRFGLTSFESTPSFGYYDEDDDGTLDSDEAIMLDADNDEYVTIGDARLGQTKGGSGGTVVELGDSDATHVLKDFDETWTFHHRDRDGDGTFDSNEPVYISTGDSVATFAVRIANPTTDHPVGRQVIDFDDDWNIATREITGSLSYVDEDNSEDFSTGDALYFDTDATTDGEVSRGDIILTGSNAGQVASGATGDIGQDLESYTGTLRYFDTTGGDTYAPGDIVYADTDNDQLVNQGAAQLSDGIDPYNGDTETETNPPIITITAPQDDATLTLNESVTIKGTATEGDATLDTIELTAGDEELTVTGLENWNASWTPTASGEHTIEATATDEDGETNTTTITVNVETAPSQPPTIEIATPTEDSDANVDTTLTIEGNATAGDGEITDVTVQAGEETLSVDGLEHWSAEWTPTEPGVDVITATVTDENDNTAEATVTITVLDNEPPTVTITEPEDGAEAAQGEPITIQGTATPGTAEISLVTVTVGGETLEVEVTETWQTEWTPEEEGEHTLTATVTDQAGLTESDTVTLNVAAQAPGPGVAIVLASLLAGLALAGRRQR